MPLGKREASVFLSRLDRLQGDIRGDRGEGAKSMQQQRWSRAEDAVIRRYREQGVWRIRRALKAVCGTDRTVSAIRKRASRKGVSLAKYRQCEVCGAVLNKQNNSGKCPDCNLADRIESLQQRRRHLESLEEKRPDKQLRRVYDAERQAVYRMEKRMGLNGSKEKQGA